MTEKGEPILISPYVYVGMKTKDIPVEIRMNIRNLKRKYNPDMIMDAVAKVTGIDRKVIISKDRHRPIAEARQIYCFNVRHKTNETLKDIGKALGGRDHTTVLHNTKIFQSLYATDDKFKEKADAVEFELELNSLS